MGSKGDSVLEFLLQTWAIDRDYVWRVSDEYLFLVRFIRAVGPPRQWGVFRFIRKPVEQPEPLDVHFNI